MALRVLIVDDEDLARLRLKNLLADCPEPRCEVVGEAANAAQALAWLGECQADLALLDVQMPGADGTALAARLRELAPQMAVVFVTAYAEHAVKAFELEATDYLTKPVKLARLQEALQRVARRAQAGADGAAPVVGTETQPDDLVVNDRGRVVRVPVADILFLKAELKYVTLRTALHTYVLDDSLTELEQRLGTNFVRIHRNALVSRHAMRALERRHDDEDGGEVWALRVGPTDEWLAVSRRQVAAVREAVARTPSVAS
jgi:two-component system response regulator AlgR